MRILLINKYYYLRGGAERYFFDLKDLLEEKGRKVIPFSMKHKKNYHSDYENYFADEVDFEKNTAGDTSTRCLQYFFKFARIKKLIMNANNAIKFFYNYDAVKNLEKLIKAEKPDIAHIHNIAHQLGPAIISVLKKQNIPIVQTLHDYKMVCPAYLLSDGDKECRRCFGGKYYNCFLGKCVKNSSIKSFAAMCETYLHNKILKSYDKVDLFIAPTKFARNIYAEAGVDGDRIKAVKGFLDGELLERNEEKVEKISNFKFQISKELTNQNLKFKRADDCGRINDNYILYFGRLSKEKGIYVLLDAMKKVDAGIKLKIVGDGGEKENFKFQISNFKMDRKIELVGARYGKELQDLISSARAVIIPSICPESMCYSLLEAMLFGKIVIASRIGAMTEIIKEGNNGFLFNPGDSNDLANKINLLFAGAGSDSLQALTPLDISDITRRAKETALGFDREKHYQEIMRVYEELT